MTRVAWIPSREELDGVIARQASFSIPWEPGFSDAIRRATSSSICCFFFLHFLCEWPKRWQKEHRSLYFFPLSRTPADFSVEFEQGVFSQVSTRAPCVNCTVILSSAAKVSSCLASLTNSSNVFTWAHVPPFF